MKEATAKYGEPEIMSTPLIDCFATNCRATEQGSQFTGFEWTQALKDAGVKISMDGRGRWTDNRMIERRGDP